ncbi:MAG: glycine--tRNA ligase subunit alpha [Candidatus Kaelpia aquatica]|nr:glycine--tRNA ligase subunit alpha [Candidatus Kaelpia aquatica]
MKKNTPTFEEIIAKLNSFWSKQGCSIIQPYDMEVGAGTFHPATFFSSLDKDPKRFAYVQGSRRPTDGRYGDNPLRASSYYQYQVILKPSPDNVKELYLKSLKAMGFKLEEHDLRFVEDDWESPTLGAWGLGWEVWLDSLEVTQFTYFQQIGGFDLNDVTVEITYGLERLSMYLQDTLEISELIWSPGVKYGDLHSERERELCSYNFKLADIESYKKIYSIFEKEGDNLLKEGLLYPAYEMVLKLSHIFNILDARGALSVTERQNYITSIRKRAKGCAGLYLKRQES